MSETRPAHITDAHVAGAMRPLVQIWGEPRDQEEQDGLATLAERILIESGL